MNREELEGRSKSELIDLLVQQQTHLAQLQARAAELQAQLAQLQLSKRNGEAETAALPDIPAGRFPLTLKLIAIAGLALACGIVVIVASFRPGARIAAGKAQDYAPGSITIMQLPAPDRGAQAIPILLVNDLASGFLALYARDPGSNTNPPSCGTPCVGFSNIRLCSGTERLKRRPARSSTRAS